MLFVGAGISRKAPLLVVVISWFSVASAALGQCERPPQTITNSGQPMSFDQFNPSLGTLIRIRIEFASVLSGSMSGRRESSASNYFAVLCGYQNLMLPGTVNPRRHSFLLCVPVFAPNDQDVSVSMGGDTWAGTIPVIGGSMAPYIGAGQFFILPSRDVNGVVYRNTTGVCPTLPPEGFGPPCQNVPGGDGSFSSSFTITQSVSVSVTFVYECAADTNCDGVRDSTDFFEYLEGFFESAPAADIDSSGTVDSSDFFGFLEAFFEGC